MSTFNELTLKALLLDTITYLKTGKHIALNYKTAKKSLCEMSNQPTNISAKQLLHLIGLVYEDNKKAESFWATIDKFDAEKYLN